MTAAQKLGLRALASSPTGRLSCGRATGGSTINWAVADKLIAMGFATARAASPTARPYGVEITEAGKAGLAAEVSP